MSEYNWNSLEGRLAKWANHVGELEKRICDKVDEIEKLLRAEPEPSFATTIQIGVEFEQLRAMARGFYRGDSEAYELQQIAAKFDPLKQPEKIEQ